jgi:hypothetical protein
MLYLQAKQSFNDTVATRFASVTFVLMRSGCKLAMGRRTEASKSLVLASFMRTTRGPLDPAAPGPPSCEETTIGCSLEETSGLTQAWEGAMKSSKLFRNTLPDIVN